MPEGMELKQQCFQFGPHALQVLCRRMPEEVSGVRATLQLDIDELFAKLLDWPSAPTGQQANDAAAAPSSPPPGDGVHQDIEAPYAQQQQQQQQQRRSSKQICGNVDDSQPDLIGLDVWPAAVALCTYLSNHPQLVAAAAVAELGAGMGLPGILAAKLGAAQVLLTDYEPVVVEQVQQNAALNGVQEQCSCLALDWFDLTPLGQQQRQAYNLVLLADVIYAAEVVEALVGTIQALLHPTGAALVAHRIRRPLVFDRTENIAKLEERDEIFERFQRGCRGAGLRLRFLNATPAAWEGQEPLLLAIAASEERLAAFPCVE